MAGNFFRGTSVEQDGRFGKSDERLMAKMAKAGKFSPILDTKVNVKKINIDFMTKWITAKIIQVVGFEDDILINLVVNILEGETIDPKKLQLDVTGFLEKQAQAFVEELWTLLVDAQDQPSGIPSVFIQQKKDEILSREKAKQQVVASMPPPTTSRWGDKVTSAPSQTHTVSLNTGESVEQRVTPRSDGRENTRDRADSRVRDDRFADDREKYNRRRERDYEDYDDRSSRGYRYGNDRGQENGSSRRDASRSRERSERGHRDNRDRYDDRDQRNSDRRRGDSRNGRSIRKSSTADAGRDDRSASREKRRRNDDSRDEDRDRLLGHRSRRDSGDGWSDGVRRRPHSEVDAVQTHSAEGGSREGDVTIAEGADKRGRSNSSSSSSSEDSVVPL